MVTALPVTIAATNRLPSKPAKSQGTTSGILQKSYSYTASAIDPDGDDVQITFDWGDESSSVTEFAKSAEKISGSHAWQRSGTYYVRAKATDRRGGQSAWSTYLAVRITANIPPKKPSTPAGVASGYVGKSYSFTGYTTDPNRDQIFYTFDWGDGSTSQTEPGKFGNFGARFAYLEPGGNISGPGHGHRQQWSCIALVHYQKGENL